MRTWIYTWKSSDGRVHEGEVESPSKDDVYKLLRKRSIRAIKVTERIQPIVQKGFSGLSRRDWSVVALFVVVVICVTIAFVPKSSSLSVYSPNVSKGLYSPTIENIASPLPRRQINGFSEKDLDSIFANCSEVFIARFAQPGFISSNKVDTADLALMHQNIAADLISCLKNPIMINDEDGRSVIELKRIVAGLKSEIALLLASGRGVNDIFDWLEGRQKMESDYRLRIIQTQKRSGAKTDDINKILQTMNLKEVD